MPAQDMPAAEVDVDGALVRALLAEQHPDLADLPLELAANGWDNVLFRLGDDLAVRLPRRQLAVPLVEHEQRWLPELAPRLPLPIPAPLRVGHPGAGYPWRWSVCPWFEGRSALVSPPTDLGAAALALGGFLAALHVPAAADAPTNPFRGIPLPDRDERTLASIDALADEVDAPRVRGLWAELRDSRPWDGPPVWLHGDLHPGNLVVRDGTVVAVVDFGDLTSGDPACDLAVAWMLLPPEHHAAFRTAAGIATATAATPAATPAGTATGGIAAEADAAEALWARARGWALALGLVTWASSADNPPYAAHGRRTVAAALAG